MMQGSLLNMISMVPYGVYTASISFKSQIEMLSYNINHVIVNREVFLLGGREIEKQVFNIYFLK